MEIEMPAQAGGPGSPTTTASAWTSPAARANEMLAEGICVTQMPSPGGQGAPSGRAKPVSRTAPLANETAEGIFVTKTPSADGSEGMTMTVIPPVGGGAQTATDALFPSGATATRVAEIVELGGRRRFAISVQQKVSLATGSMIRRLAGWRADLPEAERERIARRARRLVAAIEAGKATDDPIGPVAAPLVLAAQASRQPFDALRREVEREMRRLARRLPGYGFAKSVAGFGDLGFAVVVAEAGAVGEYRTVQGLWKRCGLGLVGGERQRLHRDPELAALHGYNPRRRGEMYAVVAEPLLRAQWRGEKDGEPAHPIGPYGEAYGRKKAEYAARDWRPKHAHMAASRYMTKLLLRDLCGAWRRDVKGEGHDEAQA